MKIRKNKMSAGTKLHDVSIHELDIPFVASITLEDIYDYFYFCREKRNNSSRTIARKMSTLRVYFKYMTQKMHYLSTNPMESVQTPSLSKTLPKHLSLEESAELLNAIKKSRRDYAIITLFLNCGMRLAELVSLNVKDVRSEYVVITGKGNKQRTIHLNQACRAALDDYIQYERPKEGLKDPEALFISRNKCRISRRAVQNLVEKYLKIAGLDDKKLSTHKLRHTAATLMHRHGHVDIRVLQEILGHENLGTTQIYTHVDSETVKEASMSNPLSQMHRKPSNEE
jgi:site-specific recombinase XerD